MRLPGVMSRMDQLGPPRRPPHGLRTKVAVSGAGECRSEAYNAACYMCITTTFLPGAPLALPQSSHKPADTHQRQTDHKYSLGSTALSQKGKIPKYISWDHGYTDTNRRHDVPVYFIHRERFVTTRRWAIHSLRRLAGLVADPGGAGGRELEGDQALVDSDSGSGSHGPQEL
ncbi:uncharacterized protein EHS24_009701 [Apiotrichum porosum]|uniref:Uncharacterized protein n=1 Tax=Apiotrichum porosum TaxID=105984 RepID=A0A427XM74_9TREE|nr:uncharacterized protein EHS24_009701 [Apiotrichum porosum]RSH80029.1 hypothetical protein EHS24_009701 [Apiotrichum porosum]